MPPAISQEGTVIDPEELQYWIDTQWEQAFVTASQLSKHHLASWKEKIKLAVECADMKFISRVHPHRLLCLKAVRS